MSLVISYASTFIDLKDLQSTTDPEILLGKIKSMMLPILAVSLINLLFTTIFQHYVLFNPLGGSGSIFESALSALRYFIPYLIIVVLLAFFASVAILLGFFVLIVGALFALVYVMALYLLILPVLMAEGPSIGNVISRTFSLMHRNFWANIGWVAVFIILLLVISVILSGIILLPFSGSFFRTLMHPEEASALVDMTTNPLFIGLSALASALTFPLMPVFSLILYFNGRADEEKQAAHAVSEPEENRLKVEDLYARPIPEEKRDNTGSQDNQDKPDNQ
jgi:hypothetical protein